MYLLLLGLLPMVAIAGLLHLRLAVRRTLVQLAVCLALTFAAGTLSTQWQRARVDHAISTASPGERFHLAVLGYDEASRPTKLSLAVVLVGLLPFTVGELRRGRRSAAARPAAPPP